MWRLNYQELNYKRVFNKLDIEDSLYFTVKINKVVNNYIDKIWKWDYNKSVE